MPVPCLTTTKRDTVLLHPRHLIRFVYLKSAHTHTLRCTFDASSAARCPYSTSLAVYTLHSIRYMHMVWCWPLAVLSQSLEPAIASQSPGGEPLHPCMARFPSLVLQRPVADDSTRPFRDPPAVAETAQRIPDALITPRTSSSNGQSQSAESAITIILAGGQPHPCSRAFNGYSNFANAVRPSPCQPLHDHQGVALVYGCYIPVDHPSAISGIEHTRHHRARRRREC